MKRIHAALALALTAACAHGSTAGKGEVRLPNKDTVLAKAQERWGDQFQQVPSIIIDKGPLAHVPYYSFKSGDYEVNVYGDPAAPACVEVGTYAEGDEPKRQVKSFVEKLLPKRDDAEAMLALNAAGEAKEIRGLTFEATPPSAPDAYGAWWISIYDKQALADARADVVDAVSEATAEEEEAKDAAKKKQRSWNRSSYSSSSRYRSAAPSRGGRCSTGRRCGAPRRRVRSWSTPTPPRRSAASMPRWSCPQR